MNSRLNPLLAYALGSDTVSFMQVTKVKYSLWAADWQRCRPCAWIQMATNS
jgi:hypothetical protein